MHPYLTLALACQFTHRTCICIYTLACATLHGLTAHAIVIDVMT